MLRERAGIDAGGSSMYGLKAGMSKDEMREAIRLERRIELAYEGHRFWDVRRWMIADETENKMMTGMQPQRQQANDPTSTTFTRFDVYQHVFHKQMYLWPIPNREVSKSPQLKQNPYY
jgi:hypothetical protein